MGLRYFQKFHKKNLYGGGGEIEIFSEEFHGGLRLF